MQEDQVNSTSQEQEKEYPAPPPHIKVGKNGIGYDMIKKKIVDPPGTYADAPNQITKANAAALARRKHQKTKDAIASAIAEQAQEAGLNVRTPSEALGAAAGILFRDVIKGKGTLRDRNTTLWSIGKYSDLVESHDKAPSSQANVQINITSDALREILSTTGGQTIDGTWTDSD